MANTQKGVDEKIGKLTATLEFPKWLWRLATEQSVVTGIPRIGIFKRWLFEGARQEFPDRVPDGAGQKE